jgi:hypothetical protein
LCIVPCSNVGSKRDILPNNSTKRGEEQTQENRVFGRTGAEFDAINSQPNIAAVYNVFYNSGRKADDIWYGFWCDRTTLVCSPIHSIARAATLVLDKEDYSGTGPNGENIYGYSPSARSNDPKSQTVSPTSTSLTCTDPTAAGCMSDRPTYYGCGGFTYGYGENTNILQYQTSRTWQTPFQTIGYNPAGYRFSITIDPLIKTQYDYNNRGTLLPLQKQSSYDAKTGILRAALAGGFSEAELQKYLDSTSAAILNSRFLVWNL